MRVDIATEDECVVHEKSASISGKPRFTYFVAYEARVAGAVVRGQKTLAEPTQQCGLHPNRITDWKNPLLITAAGAFGSEPRLCEPTLDLKVLHANVDQLALENAS